MNASQLRAEIENAKDLEKATTIANFLSDIDNPSDEFDFLLGKVNRVKRKFEKERKKPTGYSNQ